MDNNGIEKIIGKILEDAREEAAKLTADAEDEARDIISENEEKAKEISAEYALRADRIKETAAQKAGSATELQERTALLEAKSDIMDEVFEAARAKICSLGDDDYFAFLRSLLFSALDDRISAQNVSRETGDEICVADEYVLRMNKSDREKYAEKLIAAAEEKYPGIAIKADQNDVPADGGLILTGGDMEVCCTVKLLVERTRDRIEREVASRLFDH